MFKRQKFNNLDKIPNKEKFRKERINVLLFFFMAMFSISAGLQIKDGLIDKYFIKSNLDTLSPNVIDEIVKYPNIEYIFISGSNLNITTIEKLNQLKKLKGVDIRDQNINKIEGIENSKELEELSITNSNLNMISDLSNNNNLKTLDLSGNNIEIIENVEDIGTRENVICYNVAVKEKFKFNDKGRDYYEKCNKEPKEYANKHLYNKTRDEGEQVATLRNLYLTGNPLKYITVDSLEYINEYQVNVYFNNELINYENAEYVSTWYENIDLEVIP